MGDRANIKIKQENGQSIWLYTHWEGHEWPRRMQTALKEVKPRWDDEPYLTRYLITGMIPHRTGECTGYGVGTYPCDNEHDVYEVDCGTQTVRKWPAWVTDHPDRETDPLETWTFEDFAELDLGK